MLPCNAPVAIHAAAQPGPTASVNPELGSVFQLDELLVMLENPDDFADGLLPVVRWSDSLPMLPVLPYPYSSFAARQLVTMKRREIRRLLIQQNPTCQYCGHRFGKKAKRTLDHVIPLHKGGTHWVDNLRLACGRCNSIKGCLMPQEWISELLRIVDAVRLAEGIAAA